MSNRAVRSVPTLLLCSLLVACGSGGGGAGPDDAPPSGGPYTFTGTMENLQGQVAVLVGNAFRGGDVSYSATMGAGSFTTPRRYQEGERIYFWHDFSSMNPRQDCRAIGSQEPGANPVREAYWSGVYAGADLSGLIRCDPGFALGGVVIGGRPGQQVSVTLHADGRLWDGFEIVGGSGDNVFTFTPVLSPGTRYVVTANDSRPLNTRPCLVKNGTGTMPARDVLDLEVYCGAASISYTLSGLRGTGLEVALSRVTNTTTGGSATLEIERDTPLVDGTYTFDYKLNEDDEYLVSVVRQPDPAPDGVPQACEVVNGSGTIEMEEAAITDVEVRCPDVRKSWRFDDETTIYSDVPLRRGEAGYEVVDETYTYSSVWNTPGRVFANVIGLADTQLFREYYDHDGAIAAIYSNPSGRTYWLAAESPSWRAAIDDPSEHWASLRTVWTMEREAADASFALELSAINLIAYADAAGSNRPFGRLQASAIIRLRAYRLDENDVPEAEPFYDLRDQVILETNGAVVEPIPRFRIARLGANSIADSLEANMSVPVNVTPFRFAQLIGSIPLEVNLGPLSVGQRFVLVAETRVLAANNFSPESTAVAYLRDPAQFDPGDPAAPPGPGDAHSIAAIEGLRLLATPPLPPDLGSGESAGTAPACGSTSGARAMLQLGATAYTIAESDRLNRVVTVERTGSSSGDVSARIQLQGTTATAGADFEQRDIVVRFADGESAPRTVELPVLDDAAVEGDETLALQLTGASGCADVGARSNATLTIGDDDAAPAASYTIGGTVTGLAGSGLVLRVLGLDLPVAANGTFAFPRTYASGVVYEVTVAAQPEAPRQSCSVANGGGTVAGANVTNVAVTCATLAEPGGLDTSFGTGGRVYTAGVTAGATDLALQPDGKLLVVGGNQLLRYLPNGAPDPNFGTNGAVTVTFYGRSFDVLEAVAVQPDGRIVVAGASLNGVNDPRQDDFVVARFLADGSPDLTFGNQGKVIADLASRLDRAYHLLVQPDGRIVVVGIAATFDLAVSDLEFAALRLTSSGQPDASFGTRGDGWAVVDVEGLADQAYTAALQPDGGIVIAGLVQGQFASRPDVALVRLTSSGLPDAAFGTGGIVERFTDRIDDRIAGVLVQPDGRIVAAGQYAPVAGTPASLLQRYLADGTPDGSFGAAGATLHAPPARANAIARQPDGRLVVVGPSTVDLNAPPADFRIERFDGNGVHDAAFGPFEVDFYGAFDEPKAVVVQPDGRIVVAGRVRNGTAYGIGLVRVTP